MNRVPADAALLLIDVINDFEFEGSDALLRHALPAAGRLARLKRAARRAGVPVIYVNDNFGRWQSTFEEQIARCTAAECPGKPVVEMLAPARDDYFVLKPMHSGFYSTSLEVLLGVLKVRTLVLARFAGDICVLYTANDAYMRGYELIVAHDCIASETLRGNRAAVEHMRTRLKAPAVTARTLMGGIARKSGRRG